MSGKQWNMDKATQDGIAARAENKSQSFKYEDLYYIFDTAHEGARMKSESTNKVVNVSEETFEGNLRWIVDTHGVSMKGRALIARYQKGVKL